MIVPEPISPKPHSARVEMALLLKEHRFRLRQLGPDFAILAEPASYPPALGEIALSVDGQITRWLVRLDHGLNVTENQFAFTTLPADA